MVFNFQQYFNYIVAISILVEESGVKPPTCSNSMKTLAC